MVFEAMKDSDLSKHYFLDIETGEVEFVSEMFDDNSNKMLEEIEKQSNRYFKIPQIPSDEQYQWMKEFVQEFVGYKDKDLQEKLEIALNGKGAFSRFKDVLYAAGGAWLDTWQEWERSYLYEELAVWLAGLPIDIKEDSEYFGAKGAGFLVEWGKEYLKNRFKEDKDKKG